MKRSRKNSQELFKFYQSFDISYFDLNNSYIDDYDANEEATFQNCFENFFKQTKEILSEDHEELNNLLFISLANEKIQISPEISSQNKQDISVHLVDRTQNINLLNKKRKIFQINSGITLNKNTIKPNKKIKFVTYNVIFIFNLVSKQK